MTAKKKAAPKVEKVVRLDRLDDVPGLGSVSAERLAEKGITNMLSLWAGCNNPIKLSQITGMEKSKAVTCLKFVREHLEKANVIGAREQTADKTYEDILKRKHLRTGCSNIDNALRGGFEEHVLYEVFGHEGAGKTQLLHTLAINSTLPLEDGGLWDKVNDGDKLPQILFIDTENTFRPDRIHSILEGKGMITQMPAELTKKRIESKEFTEEERKTYNETFKKQIQEAKDFMQKHILHWKSTTAASLFVNLENANSLISTGFPIKLVIIDSFTNVFRGNYIGRGTMWSKSDDSRDLIKIIKDLTETHKIIVIFVTQVYGNPDKKGPWEPDVIAYGGHIVGHAPQIRLMLDIPSKNPTAKKRRMSIVKAPHLPNDSVFYEITNSGLENHE